MADPRPLAPSDTTDWLLELCGDGLTGFMPPAMPDAVWVLNAMHEHEAGPADVSYHEYRQAGGSGGRDHPARRVRGMDLEMGTTTGGGLSRAEHPGHGRRRLRWAEPARRTADPLVPDGPLTCHHPSNLWAQDRSWVVCTDYDLWATKVAGRP
ncbi:hypothetical protein [Streptomyces yangpuensis]|uniref:hypothetical protein n=1 Tax=Streptomyces yangpuensis TaxID=1648182 RepID=UPI003657B281